MPTTTIGVFTPEATNSFIINSDAGGYALFTLNVTTGVVTSTILPAATTDYLTLRVQQVQALDPSITGADLASVARSLMLLKQTEGSFGGSFSVIGPNYTFDLTLAPISHLLVSIALSSSSPFDSAEAGGSPGGGGTPGGVDTNIQFNDGGVFGGNNKLVVDKLTGSIIVGGNILPPLFPPGSAKCVIESDNLAGIGCIASSFFPAVLFAAKNTGTLAAPLPVADGDLCFIIGATGAGSDNAYDPLSSTYVITVVDGVPGPGYVPGKLVFATKPAGGVSGVDGPITRMVIRGDGTIVMGLTDAIPANIPATATTPLVIQSDGIGFVEVLTAGADSSMALLAKASGTLAAPTSVADTESLGKFAATGWASDNNPDLTQAAWMDIRVDGAPQAGYVPSKILFSTKPVGGGPGPVAPVTRMTIRGDGFVGVNTDTRVEAEVFGCSGGILTTGAVWMGNLDQTGTPGNVTIDKPTGRAAIALGASTITILNSFVQAGDTIMVTGLGRDLTCVDLVVDSIGAGTFTVSGAAAATADTNFMFLVIKATP
jgi:hypothetical protein